MSDFTVEALPRGGQLVSWAGFLAQIGAYPETIKDTMKTGSGVPNLFLMPEKLFDLDNGVSLAELEFPLYYSFYLKGAKLRFLCRPHQCRPLFRLLREAVFGPSSLKLEGEFPRGEETEGYPDLRAEADFYKVIDGRRLKLADVIEPIVCPEGETVLLDGVKVSVLPGDRYGFERDGVQHTVAFQPLEPPSFPDETMVSFDPPDFGVTVLGAGHGFDVDSRTSGFILWIDGRGLVVDPPVHTTQWMRARGLDQRLVEDILLTHCHADHDSGTLQKVLEEGRVRLHTTPTVQGGFVRKYRSLLGLRGEELERLFDFQPVLVGPKISILGARFRFWYTFHPIPTLGFECEHRGRRFAYSCDTLYDPSLYADLHARGVISTSRQQVLEQFPWDADLIFHEAGMPPIHTPVPILAELPTDVRDRLYLTHVSRDILGSETRLKVAPAGIRRTLVLAPFSLNYSEERRAERLLDLLLHSELFAQCSLEKSLEFLYIAKFVPMQAGDEVIKYGDWGDRFFLVSRGSVGVFRDGMMVQRLRRFDYFGEMAIVLGGRRVACVKALTDGELVAIDRSDFLQFIANTRLPGLLRRAAVNKMNDLWSVMRLNRRLEGLTPFQRGQLSSVFRERQYQPGEILVRNGDQLKELFLVAEGMIELEVPMKEHLKNTVALGDTAADMGSALPMAPLKREIGRGELFGCLVEPGREGTMTVTARALGPTRVFVASLARLQDFWERNPGTYVRLAHALRRDPVAHAR